MVFFVLVAHLNTIMYAGMNAAIAVSEDGDSQAAILNNSFSEYLLEDLLNLEDVSADDDDENRLEDKNPLLKDLKYCQYNSHSLLIYYAHKQYRLSPPAALEVCDYELLSPPPEHQV